MDEFDSILGEAFSGIFIFPLLTNVPLSALFFPLSTYYQILDKIYLFCYLSSTLERELWNDWEHSLFYVSYT